MLKSKLLIEIKELSAPFNNGGTIKNQTKLE
jgi:hypothetical protein